MEKFMLKAHELQAQGFTQKQIAEQLYPQIGFTFTMGMPEAAVNKITA